MDFELFFYRQRYRRERTHIRNNTICNCTEKTMCSSAKKIHDYCKIINFDIATALLAANIKLIAPNCIMGNKMNSEIQYYLKFIKLKTIESFLESNNLFETLSDYYVKRSMERTCYILDILGFTRSTPGIKSLVKLMDNYYSYE